MRKVYGFGTRFLIPLPELGNFHSKIAFERMIASLYTVYDRTLPLLCFASHTSITSATKKRGLSESSSKRAKVIKVFRDELQISFPFHYPNACARHLTAHLSELCSIRYRLLILQCSNLNRSIQKRKGVYISCALVSWSL